MWKTTYYSNPLLIIAAISIVLCFKDMGFKSIIINNLASSAQGIYLFQNADLVSDYFYRRVGATYSGVGVQIPVDNCSLLTNRLYCCNCY